MSYLPEIVCVAEQELGDIYLTFVIPLCSRLDKVP